MIKVLGIVFFVSIMILFGVDYFFFLKNRYSRFHIGRWKCDEAWSNAVYKIVLKWSKRTPTVKITDNSRYVLLDMLQGKYRSNSIQSWQNAAIILGLLEKEDYSNLSKCIRQFVDENGEWIKKPVAVDHAMLAYAILKGTEEKEQVKPAMDFMISLIENNIDENNIIRYTIDKNNSARYVDTVGLVCPFLALYAKVYNKSKYEELAFMQLQFYHRYGLLGESNLPNHAVEITTYLPLGVYGWGRGVAWYIIGLLDTFEGLEKEIYRKEVEHWIKCAAQSYLKFQHNDGGFGSILQYERTYDSSSTATLAWFYAKCGQMFSDTRYYKTSKNCLQKLKTVTRISGAIDWCQGDTKDIGIFAQTYDLMPFAQGMTLRAIECLRKAK